jgi:SAM-dependent methyltransferase
MLVSNRHMHVLDETMESQRETANSIARDFYFLLRKEVTEGNSYLGRAEQSRLRSHYPVMLNSDYYPAELAATIYVNRRVHAVRAILDNKNAVAFDAGCGYGSESFLFASAGAKVLAVDHSAEQIEIAKKRQHHYEDVIGRELDVTFVVADLENYKLNGDQLSLTWVASVLAAIQDQEAFLKRIHDATVQGGKIIITDMNLLNPLFLFKEWLRRRKALNSNPEFAEHLSFLRMFLRKNRKGARFYSGGNGKILDDVQFFWTSTLSQLLARVGFLPQLPHFSGFLPPPFFRKFLTFVEQDLSRIPVIRSLGYFYLVAGIKGNRDK